MLLFTIIFFAVVIVVGVSMTAGFSFLLKRRSKRLSTENQNQFNHEPPPYRSLFAPDDEEIRAFEREKDAEASAKASEAARLSASKKIEAVRDFREIWTDAPDRSNTPELFRRAADSANAEIFSETAETVIRFWRENKIANLTANDLAGLLDSHLRTLPQQERLSGAIFWIRREIENLRGKSESKA